MKSHMTILMAFKGTMDEWLSTPPRFTVVRVNTLVTNVEEVANHINLKLQEESNRLGLTAPSVLQHPTLPDCLVIPARVHPHGQNDLPRHQHEVIVDSACGKAVLRGANVFAPGVLALLPSTRIDDTVSIYADSAGRCKQGLSVPFQDSGKLFIGNGILKTDRQILFNKKKEPVRGIAVEVTETVYGVTPVSVPRRLGLLQNLPSIVCGHVLAPRPGDVVIDLCAAPGNKTTHLAALMENKGVLVALDKVNNKIKILSSLCESMEFNCVMSFTFDSTKAVTAKPNNPSWAPPYTADTFDCVLLDAPCSSSGQRPQIGRGPSIHDLTSLPKLQRKLFCAAAELVKPGGTLVYSTCSSTTEENEDIVSWALLSFPRLTLVPALPRVGGPGIPQSKLCEQDCQLVQRFGPPIGPTADKDTIGFFIAKFTKIVDKTE